MSGIGPIPPGLTASERTFWTRILRELPAGPAPARGDIAKACRAVAAGRIKQTHELLRGLGVAPVGRCRVIFGGHTQGQRVEGLLATCCYFSAAERRRAEGELRAAGLHLGEFDDLLPLKERP